MKKNIWLNRIGLLSILFSIVIISCNKDVEKPVPNTFELPKGPTIAQELSKNPNYSLLLAIVSKVGLASAVADSSKTFTLFAPDNNAVKNFVSIATGGLIPVNAPDQVFLGFINTDNPAITATLTSIVNYHLISGLAIKAAAIGESFANTQYPTNFIFPAPNTNPIVRFSTFLSKRGANAWVNNIPVANPDLIIASNGIVHGIPAVLLPPSRILLDTISRDQDFAYLAAAIQRADSGLSTTASPSFQYFLGNPMIAPVANFTVFAPTNEAFQDLIRGLVVSRTIGAIAEQNPTRELTNVDSTLALNIATLAVAAGPAFLNSNNLTTNDVRGIVAYHVIPSKRAFTVNFPTDASDFQTLLNSSIPGHPGLKINATLSGGFGAALSVKGLANATAATAAATPFGVDRQAVNGVFYKINQVLVPVPPPTIFLFEPTSAKANDTVTITGINLAGATSVRFGGVQAQSFQLVNANTIKAVVNAGSSSGNVDLRTPQGFTFRRGFTFTNP